MTQSPSDFLKHNDLDGALAALQDQVRAKPAEAKLRTFLFQLLCVRGDWKRAIQQLKLCGELDAAALPMAQTYREAIICEVFREKVFAGEKEPLVFGEPAEWIALMIQAQKAMAGGEAGKAADLRGTAFEMAPSASGAIDGAPFDWVADADMRLGPLLEVIVNGRYYWLPFTQIAKLAVEEPEDLRDCVWTPANITLANGGGTVALIPTRYAGTEARGDGAAKLAKSTTWEDAGAETFVGLGQRLLATEAGDTALMDLRVLTMDLAVPEGAPSGGG